MERINFKGSNYFNIMLSLYQSLNLLKNKGFKVAWYKWVPNLKALEKLSKSIKYPIVLKVSSPEISHKTELGLVATSIKSTRELRKKFLEFKGKLKELGIKRAKILVQEQVEGVEVIIGAKEDKTFGKILMFGLGGIFVEIFRDVSFRVCPIDKEEALRMIQELKSKELLLGFRGFKVNLEELLELMSKISNFVIKEDVKELDLNPVIVNTNGAYIVDARILI